MGANVDEAFRKCEQIQPDCDRYWLLRSDPPHQIFLDNFYIDVYEVTNAFYRSCVEAGACSPPARTSSSTRTYYYENPDFDNYPVINVTWEQANVFCEWRGARLPTEAEWEKAARGGLEGQLFPWGDIFETAQANFCDTRCLLEWADEGYDDGFADTSPVGFYPPNGYGLYDMAGNVWEWVEDWFRAYPGNLLNDPSFGSTHRVIRGGSWYNTKIGLSVVSRFRYPPNSFGETIGFRCARSP